MNAWEIYKELENYTRGELEKMDVYFDDDGGMGIYPIECLKVDSDGDLTFRKNEEQ